jgi:hypothetical protein
MASARYAKISKLYQAEIQHYVKSYGGNDAPLRDDILTDAHFTTNVDTPSTTEAVLTGNGKVKGNMAGSSLIEDEAEVLRGKK